MAKEYRLSVQGVPQLKVFKNRCSLINNAEVEVTTEPV
jgi:hypothetical protein